MKAMCFTKPQAPLAEREIPIPDPAEGEVLLRVSACGVCRTDLHLVDGDLADPTPDVVPGHEIVGHVEKLGSGVDQFQTGDRVGVPWLAWTCGSCFYCLNGQENLCDEAQFTGCQRHGGYAEFAVADARYVFPIHGDYSDAEAAPLLCAGLIGYRSLRMAGDAERIGLYGFGAAAHIVAQVAQFEGRDVYAFTRESDHAAQDFARSLGAVWAGSSDESAPQELDAAILFAPVGALVPTALRAVRKGGTVVCGGIHMSDIPSFPYDILWGERVVKSVANLTRKDAIEFLELAPKIPVRTEIQEYSLNEANRALDDLRDGRLQGAAVLLPD